MWRIEKVFKALGDIFKILPKMLGDLKAAVLEGVEGFKMMSVQRMVNSAMRVVAISETILKQLLVAYSDLLDAIRTSNTGEK